MDVRGRKLKADHRRKLTTVETDVKRKKRSRKGRALTLISNTLQSGEKTMIQKERRR
jgi:hypothetical protein